MNGTQKHRDLFRERLTMILVLFFCVLISSSEYIIQDSPADIQQEQNSDQDKGAPDGETYLSAAVDAVVPFVFAAVDHVFDLIYEIGEFKATASSGIAVVKYTGQYSEILFEKIISTNAP